MIIENKITDFSYPFVELSFKRSLNLTWSDLSDQASKWLWDIRNKQFNNKDIYFFYFSGPFENSKLNRYFFKVNKFGYNSNNMSSIARSCVEIFKNNILYWEIFKIDKNNLSSVINYTRDQRSFFLFFSDENNIMNFPAFTIATKKFNEQDIGIDQTRMIDFLLEQDFNPIRTYGSFDDRELWCQVFS